MTEAEPVVLQEHHGPVLVVTMNRPASLNAMSNELRVRLHEVLAEADTDPDVRVIVLTGAGRAFCAGADQARPRGEPGSPDDILHGWWTRDLDHSKRLLGIMEMETPVIAAVNGWALGAGFWYTLACDISIAGESAVFGQPEVRHTSTSSFLFPALVGWKVAHRYALTGDHFDAQEALRIGVVNEVVPDDKLLERALELGQRIALVPRSSVRVNKAITNRGIEAAGLSAGMNLQASLGTIAHASTHSAETQHLLDARAKEGVRALLRLRDTPFLPEPGGPRSVVPPADPAQPGQDAADQPDGA